MSRDPIGYGAGFNIFEYVWDSPTNWIDAIGTQPMLPPGKRPGEGIDLPEFPKEGLAPGDWFKWWWGIVHHDGWGTEEQFKDCLGRGCIGASATFCGYSDIGDFTRSLTECYADEQLAHKKAEEKDCGEGESCYGTKRRANVIGVQFDDFVWVPQRRTGGRYPIRPKKPGDPINIGGTFWPIVDWGWNPNTRSPMPGFFDFQFYLPGQKCWIGGNQGGDGMMMCRCSPDEQTKKIRDAKLYNIHLWCVVCDKAKKEGDTK